MDQLEQIIQDSLKVLTSSGSRRISYAPYSMEVALDVVKRIGRGIDNSFALSPEATQVFTQMIKWFHGDASFVGDINKGILIQGPTGTGKTMAMQIMRIYQTIDNIAYFLNGKALKMNFSIIDASLLVSEFMDSGFSGIETYCRRATLCIDDIGAESNQVKYYGNDCDVVGFVIAERYARKLMTFGTTNYKIESLTERYGDRIVSRMYSLFNFIVMKGPDFRKNTKPLDS